MSEKALFINGYPANLPAASLDALEWLLAFKEIMRERFTEDKYLEARDRLQRAIDALKQELKPHLPEEYEQHTPN